MKKLFSIIIVIMFIFGCSATQETATKVGVCELIPEGSYSALCSISGATNIPLETVSGVLKTANLTGLTITAYTAQEALDFIDDIRTYLKTAQNGPGLLYSALIEYLSVKYGLLPATVQGMITISSQLIAIDLSGITDAAKVLSDYDYELLYLHLDNQEEIIRPFLN